MDCQETLALMQKQIDLLVEIQNIQSQRLDTLSKSLDAVAETANLCGIAVLVTALHADDAAGVVNRLQERLDSVVEVNHLWDGR